MAAGHVQVCTMHHHSHHLPLCFHQIPVNSLDSFLCQIEQGYMKYSNPYHNNLHAADVTQTVHYMLWVTGLAVSGAV